MPASDSIDGFDKINFVVSSQWFGCRPPFMLLVEFAKKPALDVFMVLVTPDIDDIVKEWLRPSTNRYRKPARHGRKKNYADALIDPWGTANSRLHAPTQNVWKGVPLPGSKMLFRISDTVDRVNWTSFLLEGLTNIGFQSVLGAINANKEGCEGFAYVNREYEGWATSGGAGDLTNPVHSGVLMGDQGYQLTGQPTLLTFAGPCSTSASMTMQGAGAFGMVNAGLAIRNTFTNTIIARSGAVNLEVGETVTLTVSADVAAGVQHYVGHFYDSGFYLQGPTSILSHANPLW